MNLNLSIASIDRAFSKAIRRIRPRLQPFLENFEIAVPSRDTCDSILIGITNGKPDDYFKEIENSENYFQVLIGCSYKDDDNMLYSDVSNRIFMAIIKCPMSSGDRDAANRFIEIWKNSGNQPQ